MGDAEAAKGSGVKGFGQNSGGVNAICSVTRDHLITLSARNSTDFGMLRPDLLRGRFLSHTIARDKTLARAAPDAWFRPLQGLWIELHSLLKALAAAND